MIWQRLLLIIIAGTVAIEAILSSSAVACKGLPLIAKTPFYWAVKKSGVGVKHSSVGTENKIASSHEKAQFQSFCQR